MLSVAGGSFEPVIVCEGNCGDAGAAPNSRNSESGRIRRRLRVAKKSKHFRKLQISSFYENLQKHSNTLVISSD